MPDSPLASPGQSSDHGAAHGMAQGALRRQMEGTAGPLMDIAKPLARLLLACLLLMLSPLYLGIGRYPVYWLLLPGGVLTFISCSMQGYRQPHIIAACAASILGTLAAIYLAAYALAGWL